jgi:hypothetical protein
VLDRSQPRLFLYIYTSDVGAVHRRCRCSTTGVFQKGIEIDLTDAIIKEIQRTTPWVVTSEAGAQTTLSGTITDASLRALSTNSQTGYVQEMAVELTVDFDWRDGRTGQYLSSRRAFKSMEGFVPARPTNERIELGQHAVVQEMARSIVAELRSGW